MSRQRGVGRGRLASLAREMVEEMECPVCLELPRRGRIFPCPNGHFFCQDCRGRLEDAEACAVCTVAHLEWKADERSERLLDALPAFRCGNGCGAGDMTRAEAAAHEEDACPLIVLARCVTGRLCAEEVPAPLMVRHLAETHPDVVSFKPGVGGGPFRCEFEDVTSAGSGGWFPGVLINFDGRDFYFTLFRSGRRFTAAVYLLASDEGDCYTASIWAAGTRLKHIGPVNCGRDSFADEEGADGLVFTEVTARRLLQPPSDGGGDGEKTIWLMVEITKEEAFPSSS